jgi:hypothetical protein
VNWESNGSQWEQVSERMGLTGDCPPTAATFELGDVIAWTTTPHHDHARRNNAVLPRAILNVPVLHYIARQHVARRL